jgi:hypothetical protein
MSTDKVEVPRALFDAWKGMCSGVDWNNGTHAKLYRGQVERMMREVTTIPGEPSSFATQPAALNLNDPAVQKRLAAQWGYVPAALGGVPQGWKLVPVEPTDAMLAAAAATPGIKAIDSASTIHQMRGNKIDSSGWGGRSPLQQAWAAMLSAAPAQDAPSAQDARDAEIETLKGERGVLIAIIRECDQVISTLEPESADEAEGLRQVLRSIKRITMLHQADERDLLGALSAQEVAHGNHA